MKKPSQMQVLMFVLLWLAYASSYLLRKPLGIIKLSIEESFELSDHSLGYIDLAFSLPYALVSLTLGSVGDVIGPRLTLGCGLIGSAVASSVIGLTGNYPMLLILLFVSGAFQSLAWPAACNILSSWFSEKSFTSVMGIFGTNLLVGSICGAFLTVFIVKVASWRQVFYIPSSLVAVIGIIVLCFAKNKEIPSNKLQSEANELSENILEENHSVKEKKSLNFLEVLKLPTVPLVSVSIFCTKGIRNAILFWLPFYLTSVLGYTEADAGILSLTFEIGGFLGSVLLTFLIDKFMKHQDSLATAITSFLCGIFMIVLLLVQQHGTAYLYISLFFSGAFSSTAEIIGCGSLPAKIGEKYGAVSSVTGVVNGIGSLGNVVEGPIVAWLSYYYGIKSLVFFVMFFSFVGGISSLIAMCMERKIRHLII